MTHQPHAAYVPGYLYNLVIIMCLCVLCWRRGSNQSCVEEGRASCQCWKVSTTFCDSVHFKTWYNAPRWISLFSVLTAKSKLISRVMYNCVTFCPLHFCCWFILYLTMLITVYIDCWYHCTAIVLIIPSVLWHCWSGIRKSVRPVKNGVMRCWCGHLSGVHIVCIWSSWCHCHPETLSSLVCLNPDWFYLSGTS